MDSVQIEQKTYEMPPKDGLSIAFFLTVCCAALLVSPVNGFASGQGTIASLSGMIPVFPATFRYANLSGAAMVDAQIGGSGRIISARCISQESNFCGVSVNAAKLWRFLPTARKDVRMRFEFGLVDRSQDELTSWEVSDGEVIVRLLRQKPGPISPDNGATSRGPSQLK